MDYTEMNLKKLTATYFCRSIKDAHNGFLSATYLKLVFYFRNQLGNVQHYFSLNRSTNTARTADRLTVD